MCNMNAPRFRGAIRVSADLPGPRPRFANVAKQIVNPGLSPTGVRALFEARGEVYMTKQELARINQEQVKNKAEPYKNTRNLTAGTLERRLKDEMEIFRARTGLKLKFKCTIGAHDLPYEVEQELYFALREGIINAIRHSRASELNLSLTQNQTTCRVSLRDNGVGFDTTSAPSGGGSVMTLSATAS